MSKRYPQAVLVSCEVPWDENGELIEPVFRAEVRQALSRQGFAIFISLAPRAKGMR